MSAVPVCGLPKLGKLPINGLFRVAYIHGTDEMDTVSLFIAEMDWTGAQVTLWQLSREKSLIAKRSEMKGSSCAASKRLSALSIAENPSAVTK
jgi:hypothetical protein